MREFTNRWYVVPAVLFIVAGALVSGCAGSKPDPGVVFPCVADEHMEVQVAREAALEAFSCVFKEWSGGQTLHFDVTIKNVSDKPQRYKVNIFLSNGKAVGGLIPRKTKGGLVNPGQTATFVYPVNDMHKMPKAITLVIRTVT